MDASIGYQRVINMVKVPFACGECNRILDDGVGQCHHCPNAPVTTDWQGFVVILHPNRSEIAKRLNVSTPGNYALKVNIR